MESFIDRLGLPLRGGGEIETLPPDTPQGYIADRTALIRIETLAPRAMRARLKLFFTLLDDDDILREFGLNPGWSNLTNHGNSESQLCVNVTAAGRRSGVLVAFHLKEPPHADSFIHHNDEPDYAVLGIAGQGGLYKPEWVGPAPPANDFKTVKVWADAPPLNIDYLLGINVAGSPGFRPTALFVDPKIENNG